MGRLKKKHHTSVMLSLDVGINNRIVDITGPDSEFKSRTAFLEEGARRLLADLELDRHDSPQNDSEPQEFWSLRNLCTEFLYKTNQIGYVNFFKVEEEGLPSHITFSNTDLETFSNESTKEVALIVEKSLKEFVKIILSRHRRDNCEQKSIKE